MNRLAVSPGELTSVYTLSTLPILPMTLHFSSNLIKKFSGLTVPSALHFLRRSPVSHKTHLK